ncbi:hypothetical protein [Streptomyces zaomyceticus]|uniref:hypothetical protein n=1 Tax=Streptomyces zaomyceticus TaxID=68286 RepID=UPI0038692BF9
MAVETRVPDDDREAIGRGRTAPRHARVRRPRTGAGAGAGAGAEAVDAVRAAGARGSNARGLGRARPVRRPGSASRPAPISRRSR